MENKFKDWFFNNLIYFVIFLISVVYIFTAIFTIKESGRTVVEIIVNSALILILAYAVTTLLDIQGIFKGGQTKEVKDIKTNHEEVVKLVETQASKLDEFCIAENKNNLKETRIRHLAKAGLDYDFCFNENGSAKEVNFKELLTPKNLTEDKLKTFWAKPLPDKEKTKSENDLILEEYKERIESLKYKKKMFKEAIKVKLTQLTTQDLISNGSKKNDKFDFGDTQKDYLKKSATLSFASKTLIAFVFGYFTIILIADFQWAYLLWNALQVVVFLAFGIMKYFQAYLFMQNNFVDRTKRQISILKKFLNINAPSSDTIEKTIDRILKEKYEVE